MAKLEQRKGLYGGFKPGSTGGPGTGKFKNTVKRIANNVKRKAGDIASNIKNNKNEKATEEISATGSSKNPRFLQDALNPAQNAAMTAGGSRPMTAMNNPQVDPMTGMPITQGGQANMNPNFIGGMPNSNLPTTGMLAQENIENKMQEEKYRESMINTDFGDKIEAIRGVNYTPNPNPEENYEKGIHPFGSLSGQAKSLSSRKINGATVLGGNQPTKQSGLGAVVQQDKKMPTGDAGKGIRSLDSSVQENMGYDPLSQERLTQSRRSTKRMRVKKR